MEKRKEYTICTTEKVKEIEKEIERLTEEICSNKPRAEIKALRLERAKLVKSINNYYYRLSKGESNYSTSLAMQMFGKRRRELTAEELRQYNKILQQESRKRRKEQNK